MRELEYAINLADVFFLVVSINLNYVLTWLMQIEVATMYVVVVTWVTMVHSDSPYT